MKSGPLCALMWKIITLCSRKQVILKAGHIPSRLNVIVDKLYRPLQTIQTEWSLRPEIFQAIYYWWHQPQMDLFATRFNRTQPVMGRSGPKRLPTSSHLGKVIEKLQDCLWSRIILIAPGWYN